MSDDYVEDVKYLRNMADQAELPHGQVTEIKEHIRRLRQIADRLEYWGDRAVH